MKDLTPKDKAKELVNQFTELGLYIESAKQCALIAVSNEYHSLRELLFNLRSCRVIESEKVYLHRLNQYIEEEKEVKKEIEKLLN